MPALLCDINETTLDLAPVRDAVEASLGEGSAPLWFTRLLHLSTVNAIVGPHRPFGELGKAAFLALHGEEGGETAWAAVAASFADMPAHPDVRPGIERFRAAGWQVFALTNSSPATVDAGLSAAGVADLFDGRFTVEEAGAFKPSPEPYRHALTAAGLDPATTWMVASHDWDLAGAGAVGLNTAFLARPGMPWASAYPPPDRTASGYDTLADQLLQ